VFTKPSYLPWKIFQVAVVSSFLSVPFSLSAIEATEVPTITEEGVISGTMDITFNTRTHKDTSGKLEKGSAEKGAKDEYKIAIKVAKTTEFSGKIERQPYLFSKILGREVQPAQLDYDLDLSVLNPTDLSQKKEVGKWVGVVPIDEKGTHDFGGGDNPLRIAVSAVGKSPAFEDKFGGKLMDSQGGVDKGGIVGDALQSAKSASATFMRKIGKKEVKIELKNIQVVQLDNLVLAKGPVETYPSTTVKGNLTFDYDTGNWLTDGIKFKYNLDGTDHEDTVTGSIKWEEEANRKETGKGHYELNLRFNEDRQKVATDENSAFNDSNTSAEEAFFVVDTTMPALTGKIEYTDTLNGGDPDVAPVASKLVFNLNANKLTKQQVVNFFKLWLAAVGPLNDE
jgi:hypothetical protein